jgi:hypothetical protein
MKQISITLDAPEIISVEKTGDKDAIATVRKQKILDIFSIMFKI